MSSGHLALVLHAHLPWVRHAEDRQVVEERWLYEAITESYLPLVDLLLRLLGEGMAPRVTLSVSPPLAAMLRDPVIVERYGRHLERLGALIEREEARPPAVSDDGFPEVIRFYRQRHDRICRLWEAIEGDLVGAFSALEAAGVLELMTTAATHAFLPLVAPRALVALQVGLALEQHELRFGRRPRGFWLPECGWEPSLEGLLVDHGVEYVLLETHGVTHGEPAPRHGPYAPVLCPGERLACLGRDPECSAQVWSATEGYPAEPVYREFYRDLVNERSVEELGDLAGPSGAWLPTGIKAHRITGATEDKARWSPRAAFARAREHAEDFVNRRLAQTERLAASMDRPPLIVAPFDAELFGHWWFEGPVFLEAVLRRLAGAAEGLRLVSGGDALRLWPEAQVLRPSASSWGEGGYAAVWLNEENGWAQGPLRATGRRLAAALERVGPEGGLERRAASHAVREMLLAQGSDWLFMMHAGASAGYAQGRLEGHLSRATALIEQLERGQIDEAALARLERDIPLFSEVDLLAPLYWPRA